MLTPLTSKLIRASTTFGYLTGGIPLYWDNGKQQIHTTESKIGRIRWAFTLLTSLCATIVAIVTLRNYTKQHGFFLSDEFTVIRTVILFCTLISNLFNINVLLNTHEFVSTINSSLLVYKQFEIDVVTFRRDKRSKNWCDEIFALTFLFSVTLPPQAAMIPLLRCDACILHGVVPHEWICPQSIAFTLQGFNVPTISCSMIIFAIIQCLYLSQVTGSALLIMAVWYPYLFYGLEIMNILNARCLNRVTRRDFRVFKRTYRCFQILQKKLNLCLGNYFMTGHIFLFSGLFIMAFSGLIKVKLGALLAIIFVGWTLVYLLHYILILSRLWKFSECTEELLRNTRYHWNSLLGVKYLRPFKPLTICFGIFCDFDRNTYIFIGNFVLGFTINILLMQPNGHNQKMRF